MDTNANLDSLIDRERCIAFGDAALDLDGAAHSLHGAGEFDQQPIAGGLDRSGQVRNLDADSHLGSRDPVNNDRRHRAFEPPRVPLQRVQCPR